MLRRSSREATANTNIQTPDSLAPHFTRRDTSAATHRKLPCPFLTMFVADCIDWNADSSTLTRDIFTEFQHYLMSKTSCKVQLRLGNSFIRFSRQMRSHFNEHYQGRSKQAYSCTVRGRARRWKQTPTFTLANADQYLALEADQLPELPLRLQFINKTIGHGVVTKRPVFEAEILTEYAGEQISVREAELRELHYASRNMCPTMFHVGPKLRIDGYRHRTGEPITDINKGLFNKINHSKTYANVAVKAVKFKGEVRLLVVALTNIDTNIEICYDYADTTSDEPWMHI